ncbi:MAG: ArnT family glycosyltransferase [Anaerolineae bacterium]
MESQSDPRNASKPRPPEWVWAAFVLAGAALIRWPHLQRIPRFTDEVLLWRLAVDVLQGGYRPLVFEDTGYNGPILIYLLAALRSATSAVTAPRLLALALGSGSVLLVYLLGRELRGRPAGIVAAAFMGITATPVLVYSHILHMTSLAVPLLCLSYWAATQAARRGSGPWLLLTAVSAGLAVQTHPLCAAFLPGLLLWLWRRPPWRRRLIGPWGALALLVLLAAYSPVIVHLLRAPGGEAGPALSGVAEDLGRHLFRGQPYAKYAKGMVNLSRSLMDALSGTAHDAARPAAQDPLVWLMLGLVLAGLWSSARRGRDLPLHLTVSAMICLPLLMAEYDNTLLARYSGLALPALHLAIGVGAADWLQRPWAGGRDPGRNFSTASSALLITIALAALAGRLIVHYRVESAARRSNDDLLTIASLAEASGQPVILDGRIKRTNGRGTGPSGVLQGIFAWRGVELKKQSDPTELDAYLQAISWPAQVVLSDDTLPHLDAGLLLRPVPAGHVAPISDVGGWGLYALEPR